jgi:hypothetical protein
VEPAGREEHTVKAEAFGDGDRGADRWDGHPRIAAVFASG